MNICVIDVGTSSIRSAVTDGHRVICFRQERTPPDMPEPGLVEFDAKEMAAVILKSATEVIDEVGGVNAVAVTNQRGTAMVWDRKTGEPVGPALGWQDLRTVGECLAWKAEGLDMVPNESATKLVYLLDHHDHDRSRDLCFGTVDTWTVWCLSQGAHHVVDPSNAAMSGMLSDDGTRWSDEIVDRLGVPPACLPEIVDSTGVVGAATALPGSPPIAGIIGDQQSSLIGQRCVLEGLAKLTFGTGAFLDVCTGPGRPIADKRSDRGTFPIVAWQEDGAIVWGVEAFMIAAGSNMSWLIDDVGLLADASESTEMASSVNDTGGVVFVPALYGLGTPYWDFGARAALFGISGGTTAAHIVRAVFEGVAHRAADLLEAAEADSGYRFERIRVDGGMSQNPVFNQILADSLGRTVELCPVPEGTALGAAVLAGRALGQWSSWQEVADSWAPRAVVEPQGTVDRDRWQEAVQRATRWYPELSDIGL
ncbi:MAG: glycerol kinase [Acidimicrobiia bacterium]|nr:glycerol kinase [Acidimicrobiia bacterium]MYB73378.1 glycerol kinase [Acidimicrobiia bacterium]MYH98448.1 glycerol kinase [Acidimicrobiia bacterium]